jgi:hypothetical protein
MKSLKMLLFALGVALLATVAIQVPTAFCAGPGWVFVDENEDSTFSYDKNATSKPKEGVVRVMTRVVYTEEGKKDALKLLKAPGEMSKLYESRYLHDLDCAERESHLLQVTHLDKQGATLKFTDLAKVTEWEGIPPDVRLALVFERVCTQ